MVRIYLSFQDFTLIFVIDPQKFFCLRLWLPPCDSWWVQYIKIFIISTRGRNHDDLGLSSSPSLCPCHPQPYFDRHPDEKVRLKEGKTAKITDIPGFLTQCIQSKVAVTKITIVPTMYIMFRCVKTQTRWCISSSTRSPSALSLMTMGPSNH